MPHGDRFYSLEESERRYNRGELSTFAWQHIQDIYAGREVIAPSDPSYGVIANNPANQAYLDAATEEFAGGWYDVIEPDDPSYGVIPSQPSGGISSSSTLGVYMAPDYESRSSAMLGGAAYRSSRRAAGILGIPSRTGPVQRVGSNYVSPLGPGLPGPPPPPPDVEDYIPSDPVLYPDDPRYEDYSPDWSDDHNMPGRRSSRARSLTR